MFFDKFGELTKTLDEKTSSAIELTKSKNRIDGEKTLANKELKKIGAFYYERFKTGVIEDAILSYCQKAKEEIQRIKEPKNPPEKKSNLNNCPSRGETNELGMKFCTNAVEVYNQNKRKNYFVPTAIQKSEST